MPITTTLVLKKLNEPIDVKEVLDRYHLPDNDPLCQNLKLGCLVVNETRKIVQASCNHPQTNELPPNTVLWLKSQLLFCRIVTSLLTNLAVSLPTLYTEKDVTTIQGKLSAFFATHLGVGNCYEMSQITLNNIAHQNPAIHAECFNIAGGDHAIAVLDRLKDGEESNYLRWGKTAVVCDAWTGDVYPAYEIEERLGDYLPIPSGMPFTLNAITAFDPKNQYLEVFKLNTEHPIRDKITIYASKAFSLGLFLFAAYQGLQRLSANDEPTCQLMP